MRRFDHEVYLTKLRRELRRLENGPPSPIARRNARKRLLTVMRALRGAVDEAYPAIIDRTGVKRLKTFDGRKARLKRAGYVERDSVDAGRYSVLGVAVKRVMWTNGTDTSPRYFVPRWAVAIGLDAARLREAKKSVKIRSAAIVAAALASP